MQGWIKIMKYLSQILKSLNLDESEIPRIKIHGLSIHSKNVKKGDLFIAIKGNKRNGNNFIIEAINRGAVAVITDSSKIKLDKFPFFKVKNCRKALSNIASEYYDNPSSKMSLIGITGTNGKTTTALLVKSILESANLKVGLIGTLGVIAEGIEHEQTLTTPDPISLNKILNNLYLNGFTHIVMEVSSHAIDQARVEDINFEVAAFTNITPEHLDYHENFEKYKETKAKLFQRLTKYSKSIINVDDDFGKILSKQISSEVVPFSKKKKISSYFKNIRCSNQGIHGIINFFDKEIRIQSNLIGGFNSENILTAVTISCSLGIEVKAIEKGITECSSIPGRMESYTLKNNGIAILDYAHTPDAYTKVMITLKEILNEKGRIYVVFGAGGERDKRKRPNMAKALDGYAKHCFITPDNPRYENQNEINDQIIKGFKKSPYSVYNDRSQGIKAALNISKKNDIIAILGKGREKYQDIKGERVFHSDLDIIKEFSCE